MQTKVCLFYSNTLSIMGKEVAVELVLPLLLSIRWSVKWWGGSYVNICSGQEYPAVVEFAPFQKISKKKLKKKDAKAGSIEEGTEIQSLSHHLSLSLCTTSILFGLWIGIWFNMLLWSCLIMLVFENLSDPEYKRFLENYSCDEEKSMANPETLLGEIEAKTRELIGTQKTDDSFLCFKIQRYWSSSQCQHLSTSLSICMISAKRTTPLLEYIKNKKIEKQVWMKKC